MCAVPPSSEIPADPRATLTRASAASSVSGGLIASSLIPLNTTRRPSSLSCEPGNAGTLRCGILRNRLRSTNWKAPPVPAVTLIRSADASVADWPPVNPLDTTEYVGAMIGPADARVAGSASDATSRAVTRPMGVNLPVSQ